MSIVVVKSLDSRITKKHRLVPMTHSYLFDCKITKFFVDHGLKQSECDPCVFSSDKVVVLLFNGGSIFFSESGEDIQDILYLQEDLFEVQDIYSKSIPSITQVQDTGISSPEGASYHTRISGACACVLSVHRISPDLKAIADECLWFVVFLESSLSDIAIFHYIRKKSIVLSSYLTVREGVSWSAASDGMTSRLQLVALSGFRRDISNQSLTPL